MRRLVELCKSDMHASEVWLFGSRARGDFREDSDYDVLAIIPDDAPRDVDTPVAAFRLRRKSRAYADLLTARMSDFLAARSTPNTISFAVAHDGVRLDA
ncbi:nucleotidyltransferase domain-containing protein [Sinirhodobacter populi]|nr:nucleotidyltransferase domain-containing protein [Sinirhodobacter populi]